MDRQGKAWRGNRMTDPQIQKTDFVRNTSILHKIQSFQYLSYINYFADGSIPIEMNGHGHVKNLVAW